MFRSLLFCKWSISKLAQLKLVASRMMSDPLLLNLVSFSGFQNHFKRMKHKSINLKQLISTSCNIKWSCQVANQVVLAVYKKNKFSMLKWHLTVVAIIIVAILVCNHNNQVVFATTFDALDAINSIESISPSQALEKLSPYHNLAPDAYLDPVSDGMYQVSFKT